MGPALCVLTVIKIILTMPVELNQQALIQTRLQNLKDQQDLIGWLRLYVSVHFNPIYEKVKFSSPEDSKTTTEELESVLLRLSISLEDNLSRPVLYKKRLAIASSYFEIYISILSDLPNIQNNPNNKQRHEQIKNHVNKILNYLEARFPRIGWSGPLQFPMQVQILKSNINNSIDNLMLLFDSIPDGSSLIEMVKEDLLDNRIYTDHRYTALLGKYINSIKAIRPVTENFHTLDILLVSLNFNSFRFITYITNKLIASLNEAPDKASQFESLEKIFNQLPHSSNLSFDPFAENIHCYLSRWFASERNFHKTKEDTRVTTKEDNGTQQKIKSSLTVDQLALIFRAAYDNGIIISPSMNQLFRTIVPYLATSERQDLSYSSMRSKSYNAEIKDKDTTVAVLQELIAAIKDY